MTRLSGFAYGVYDFIVGDDWTIAVGVAAGLAATAWLAHHGFGAYVLLPALVIVLLGWSVARVARGAREGGSQPPG